MIKKKSIIVIGAGGHAKSCINTIEETKSYKISGIVGLPSEVGKSLLNYKISNSDQDLAQLVDKFKYAILAIGKVSTDSIRQDLFEKSRNLGFNFPTLVSPHAMVSRHSIIGSGTIVMPGAIINAGAVIGENCIINSRALIEHDVEVSDHCHISTGVTLNGSTFVGANSFIGSGAIVKEGIKIGANSIVGMGIPVRSNILSGTKYIGDKS